ncbi:pirin-like C-terminal cupin domain-containing protein [Halolamina sp.]|jgi:hypothetical protein|uniref:pirin-like C-terminal cupin domain-containing protein n=1 Tax=Halolamina sp. TaxID=1940283 RepID=UPI0026B09A42
MGSPLSLYVPAEYLDVRVDGEWTWTVPEGWNGFLFGVGGAGEIAGEAFEQGDVVVVRGSGEVQVAGTGRLAAISGELLDQPIKQRGPYVL